CGIWLRPELERENRISLCRSRQQQLHHHGHAERLSLRRGARRGELSLLIKTKKSSELPAAAFAPGLSHALKSPPVLTSASSARQKLHGFVAARYAASDLIIHWSTIGKDHAAS